MTLRRANDKDGQDGESETMQRNTLRCPWVSPDVQASIAEINEQYIDILVTQARNLSGGTAVSLVRELRPLLLAMDGSARRRAAACPYVLVDAGFSNPQRWDWAQGFYVADSEPITQEQYATLPKATALAFDMFSLGWCVMRAPSMAARAMLGMHERTAQIVEACSLGQMTRLARSHAHWIQARWPTHKRMWRGLLSAAMKGEGPALERARMRGVQLLAAEARSSALR